MDEVYNLESILILESISQTPLPVLMAPNLGTTYTTKDFCWVINSSVEIEKNVIFLVRK